MSIIADFPDERPRAGLKHLEVLARALDAIYDGAYKPPMSQVEQQSLVSLECEDIAQALANVAHLQSGAEPKPVRELGPMMRERFRRAAERSIKELDPSCYDDAIDGAVNDTLRWLDGRAKLVFLDGPETEDIIREAIQNLMLRMGHAR